MLTDAPSGAGQGVSLVCASPLAAAKLPLSRPALLDLLDALLDAARDLREKGLLPDAPSGLTLALLTDAEQASLNRRSLGLAGPTNVLSFPAGEPAGAAEMALAPETLERESLLYGQTPADALLRLLAHGLAHVCGLDHGPELDAAQTALERAGSAHLAGKRLPRVFRTGRVTSVMDAAREPAMAARLGFFDSLLASSQSAGRGQYRRAWSSPEGNVYAALRLPLSPPFTGTEAAVALGAWLAAGLCAQGWPCRLKWPNDVVLVSGEGPVKVCGILLEERGGVLLAGVGINVAIAPAASELREGAALPAGSLAQAASRTGLPVPDCAKLWIQLVKHIFSSYTQETVMENWLSAASRLLLWRAEPVVVDDDGKETEGLLRGVGPDGALILSAPGGDREFLSGSVRRGR